jgi:hypothetical protein
MRATECFGILHPKFQPLQDRALFRWFLANYSKPKASEKKIADTLNQEAYWRVIINNIITSP